MSDSLQIPQLRKTIAELERRIGILERRVTPQVTATTGTDNHDGSGLLSVLVAPSADSDADASGALSTAMGYLANASGASSVAVGNEAVTDSDYGTAVGPLTEAFATHSVAIGHMATVDVSGDNAIAIGWDATASGGGSVAIGENSTANHAYSIALGKDVTTTAASQFNTGNQHRVYFHCPTTAASNGHLIASQITFWVDQDAFAPRLWFQVKYSDGTTVKQGSVTLA